MGGLLGGAKTQSSQTPAAAGVQLQSSAYGKALALVVGTMALAPNLIIYTNFQSQSSGGGSSGGDKGGGGGGGGGSGSYTYSATLGFALCEGPILGVGTIWKAGVAYTASALEFTVFEGTYPQSPWSILTPYKTVVETHTIPSQAPFTVTVNYPGAPVTDHGVVSGTGLSFTSVTSGVLTASEYEFSAGTYVFPAVNAGETIVISYTSANQQPTSQALNYPGVAYIAANNYSLGNSNSLANHNVEVYGFLSNSVPNCIDADASQWVAMVLSNKKWGVGNYFPSTLIGNMSWYQSYLLATGLLISAAYTDQTTVAQMFSDIATFTNSDIAWTSTLNFLPRGDQSISANGAIYNPAASVFALTDNDWMETNNASTASGTQVTDPLVATSSDPSDLVNQVTLEYLNRANQYSPETITASDMASIEQYGINPSQSQQAHIFALASIARLSAQLILQRSRQPNTWQGTVGNHCDRIEIGDVGTISSVLSGVPKIPVRVTEITEQQDSSLTMVFEEILIGAGTGVAQNNAFSQSRGPNYTVVPPNTDTPVIFEAPLALAGEVGALEIWIYANGGVNWAGAQVWISSDNEEYAYQGDITLGARIGALTAALPAGQDPDTTDTLSLLLVENGQLLSGTQSDADSGVTLLYVDGEIISYATATLTATNAYNLTYLRRGQYSTNNGAHAVGAPVVRMDGAVFKLAYTANQIGQTLSVKFLSYNQFGGSTQQLSQVQPYSYTLTGQEAPPNITGLATTYVAGLFKLTWNIVNDPRPIDYEVRFGSSWGSGQVIGNPTAPSSAMNGDGTYWVCARYRLPGGTAVYSATPAEIVVTGSALTNYNGGSSDQAALGWPGVFTDTYLSGGYITLQGADLLSQSNILSLTDVITPNNQVIPSGTYQANTPIILSGVTACNVMITLGTVIAFDVNALDLTQVADITSLTDVMSYDSGGQAKIIPQIALSQDGVTYGSWQNWSPGSYVFKAIKFQLLLITSNVNVSIKTNGFAYRVDVPPRTDNYTVTTTGGTATQVFTMPFNGGPAPGDLPHIQYSVQNQQAGDVINFTLTLSQVVFTASNGGSPVVRTINILAQGY